ncbi:hypothetical protein TSUD_404480 [Trifolium subterraneum]|uniref:Uncharacterized protein n=1 Tax=Trifolium subterraneum TaxID=3900 RepID=A0A2Z6NWL5_TRISU|nr:hypothetical protein TSUD_404480 [Trifolium subterraneum]
MGNRKERRRAAHTNAGRRVKLDLFAEPSGELGGSTIHGDAGGDTDSQQHDGLPNSPSSSGDTDDTSDNACQQSQNPLLLLGQYSDDEVDEGSSKGPNDTKVHSHEEDAFVVPPPPDDEWIPPPPPDNEQMPPPPPPGDDQMPPLPPGDPLATCYHVIPSYTETGQPLSYAQYNPSYLGASSEYYGQTAVEVPPSNVYGQIPMPPAQLYYSAVPNIYSESSQVMINPADPAAYYEAQDGAGLKPSPDINIGDSGVVGGDDRVSNDIPSTSTCIQDPATVSADGSVSLPPATTEVGADKITSTLAAKAQTKVVRTRKRAVAVGSSLKSNKKVSSLVDKVGERRSDARGQKQQRKLLAKWKLQLRTVAKRSQISLNFPRVSKLIGRLIGMRPQRRFIMVTSSHQRRHGPGQRDEH